MVSTETMREEEQADELENLSYSVEPSWVDTSGRTRTWALKDPHGTQMAVITTKGAAVKLAQLLSGVMERD